MAITTALIADIHGNAWALDAVLADLDRHGSDQVICLGDVALLGPQPELVVQRLRAIDAITVLGNVDAWLDPHLDPAIARPSTESSTQAILAWTRERLSSDELHWLTTLPLQAIVDLGEGHSLLAFHGGPTSCDTTISAGMSEQELAAVLPVADPNVAIVASGHTHVPMLRAHAGGAIINPGSVGLPGVGPGGPGLHRNRDVAWADYVVIRSVAGARPQVTFHRLPLDVDAMLDEARRWAMPEFDWWRSCWARS